MSIAPALLMPLNSSATGETRSTTADSGSAFAALLEAEVDGPETTAAPAAIPTHSSVSPATQLQTEATADTTDAATAGLKAPAASTELEGAVAGLLASDGSGSPPALVMAQQPAAVAPLLAATIAPADAATDTEFGDISAEGAGETDATSPAVVAAAPTGVLAVSAVATAGVLQNAGQASAAVTQPVAETPESAAASEAVDADAAEAGPANPASRASAGPTPTPNQPAAAAAAAQSGPATPDTAAAKPDFAAMLAPQSAQGADAPAQTARQPSETARTTPTPAALQAAPAATIQVYNRIIERADGRAQRFEIRLDPAELGRVDVRIEIGADRKVHAVLAAHDSAALSDLMRGQRALERALADAGIDLADNGVRFELARDNGSSNTNQRDSDGRPAQADVWRRFDAIAMPATEETAAAVQPSWRPQRLDLVA